MSNEEVYDLSAQYFGNTGRISDGYHTFDELYDHRAVLYLALTNMECRLVRTARPGSNTNSVWKSKLHADGTMFKGFFILGMVLREYSTDTEVDVSYHLPMKYWYNSRALEISTAPEFDGYTPADVLDRLTDYYLG
jgi:hypothetical protein